MRRAAMRVMIMLRRKISEMVDQMRTRHHQQRQEPQQRTERNETTPYQAPLEYAW